MSPTILNLGPLTIHSYGLMLAIGALSGVWLTVRIARRVAIAPETIVDLAIVLVVTGVVGARVAYVLLHLSAYTGDWVDTLRIWDGGLAYYGALVFGMGAAALFGRRKRIPFLRLGDVVAPGLAVGYGFTRIGCLLHGCCYGKPTHFFLAIRLHPDGDIMQLTGPVHPTQIYSSVCAFVTAGVLLWLWKRRSWDGAVFVTYTLLYGVYRFLIEFLRYSSPKMMGWAGLTWAQWASVAIVFCSAVALWVGCRRATTEAARVA